MNDRPLVVVLTSHWIAMLGVALVTLAGFSWLFVLPANIRGHVENPYIGLLVFIAIPAVFLTGLILIPIGIALGRHRITDRPAAMRRAGIFFAIMTLANLVIASQGSYRAVEHMETVQFCGQTCHVMKPEFTAHGFPPHQAVGCASCHIAPGATGWVRAKMAGTRQLLAVVFNNYPRPIESAMEANKLVSSADTCEQCHTHGEASPPRLRIITEYKDDETNSRMDTVLIMLVGKIHQAHMGPGVQMRYVPQDKKRQNIPWVEYRNSGSGVTRTYAAAGANIAGLPIFEMQCVDCHNRAAHSFEDPARAIDKDIAGGQIPIGLPFVKKTGLELIKASYSSDDEAAAKIKAGLAAFYQQKYPDVSAKRGADVQAAGTALAELYGRNVFPDLKVTWGTYPNNLGHTDFPGCFRCHDDAHSTGDKKTISQDCDTCHKALAMEESSPEILKSLGIADLLTSRQKP